MPNYSLVSNAKFQPFSFERYIQPYQIYGQAYKELEDTYSTLGINANTIASSLDKNNDPKAFALYENYMNQLKGAANDIATNGLNPTSRAAAKNAQMMYSNSIIPIQKAVESRSAQIAQQLKDGDKYISSFRASDISVDDYLSNPTLTPETIDRNNLRNTSAALFSGLAKDLSDYKVTKTNPKSGERVAYYNWFTKKHGVSPDVAYGFMNDMNTAIASGDQSLMNYVLAKYPQMGAVFNNVYNSTSAPNWNNRQAQADVMGTIVQGAVAAIGDTQVDLKEDKAAVIAATRKNNETPVNYGSLYNKKPLYSVNKVEKNSQLLKKDLGKNVGYNSTENRYFLSKDGEKRLKGLVTYMNNMGNTFTSSTNIKTAGTYPTLKVNAETDDYLFKMALDAGIITKDNNGRYSYHYTKEGRNNFNALAQHYNQNGYDLNLSYEYSIPIEGSQQKEVTDILFANMPRNNKGEITAHYVDVDADNKRWVNVGKKPINREDVESVVEWNPGQYGITATVKLKDGTYQRVEVPKNLNPSALGDPYTGSIGYINQAFRSTDEINDILNHNANGEIPDMMDANGHVISYKKGNLSMEEEFQLRQKLASNENIIFAYTTKLGQMVKSEDIKVK